MSLNNLPYQETCDWPFKLSRIYSPNGSDERAATAHEPPLLGGRGATPLGHARRSRHPAPVPAQPGRETRPPAARHRRDAHVRALSSQRPDQLDGVPGFGGGQAQGVWRVRLPCRGVGGLLLLRLLALHGLIEFELVCLGFERF